MDNFFINPDQDRIAAFIRSMAPDPEPDLAGLYAQARSLQIPVVRPETASFLHVMAKIHRPGRILEVGTAVGYSALLFYKSCDEAAEIYTIERDEERARMAQANFDRYAQGGKIHLLTGDAMDILPGLQGPFDLVFMDAAKGQYIHFLPPVLNLLGSGGVLISDNILQECEILESHYAVNRRSRTIHKRMREYLYALCHDEKLDTCLLNVGDGIALSVRK